MKPADFFVFRTPLLPVEELRGWARDLEVPHLDDPESPEDLEEAVARDRRRLRDRLAEILDRPEIAEALFVASPTLFEEGVPTWRESPDSKDGLRAEGALVRYVQRMTTRATPFGLFSGCSIGRVELRGETRLTLDPRTDYRRHTRLDMDYLFALTEELAKDPDMQVQLRYRTNSSLYQAAGRWRYAEARLDGQQRSYHLVAVEPTEYLDRTLERASDGATRRELAQGLVDDLEGEVSLEEAEEYVTELVDSQLLVPGLKPLVTGSGAVDEMAELLEGYPASRDAGRVLAEVRDRLIGLDEEGLGHAPDRYRDVARTLEERLPPEVEISRLFQVDMVKPVSDAVLGPPVVEELRRGIDVLHRLFGRVQDEALSRFREAFWERYGDRREVPLVEVLDEETGIGFGSAGGVHAEASPLVAGLPFQPPSGDSTVSWGARERILLRRVQNAVAAGEMEISLSDEDLNRMGSDEPGPLPDAFHAMGVVAASSREAVEAGDFRLMFRNAAGPSGARLLGRFCHLDARLEEGVRDHLEAEEELAPRAVFAEIVHLPQGRIGNILARPVLRDWEIPYLGRSAVPEDHQIPVTDLRVSVVGTRVVLTSQRLGREVTPRLTTAHNFVTRSLGTYRFLCALQSQGQVGALTWSWGPLGDAPFLPRVRHGRLVLARARWRLTEKEIAALDEAEGAERIRTARRLREARRIPRHVELSDGDNELSVDLENVLSLESFVDTIRGRSFSLLAEPFPGDDELWVDGPEGRFVHEILIPFVREPETGKDGRQTTASAQRAPEHLEDAPAIRVDLAPGSEWLYAKLYAGTSTADVVLRDVVAPVTREALSGGAADSWYFIRYGDPRWHLRVRCHGDPRSLHEKVLPRLQEAVAPLLDDGRLWRVQLDTYQREITRYGGPWGLPVCEKLFWADSEAVLRIVELLEGDAGMDARWRLALRGVDTILDYLGLDLEAKLRVATRLRESYTREFRADINLKKALGDKHREERRSLEALMDRSQDAESDLAPGFEALELGRRLAQPAVKELRELEEAGRLTLPVEEIAPSLVHMHTNRLIRSEGRSHELVLYELLFRHYNAVRARARARAKAKAKKKQSTS